MSVWFKKLYVYLYMALMDLVENICESIDKKYYVMGIFIDLKKVFDIIDHTI